MILAAGVGSRLKPLTDDRPKALIEVGQTAMLELVLRRLIKAGVKEAVVNIFHMADRVEDFLNRNGNFGIRIELSRETELLDTGGGLKKAAVFFDDGEPFFVHNVDVFSDVDLRRLYRAHAESGALATLSARSRKSSRRFLFEPDGRLCGWENEAENRRQWAGAPVEGALRLAFDGIHVVSPDIFPKMTESGVFSINRTYLRLAGKGELIRAFRADEYYWRDVGSLAALEEVRRKTQPPIS